MGWARVGASTSRLSPVSGLPAPHVHLYFDYRGIGFHDVDNRLKDVMDALQGRAGGSKKKHDLLPIIPNDAQVWRATVTKSEPPGQSHGLGHLVIKKFVGPKSATQRRR